MNTKIKIGLAVIVIGLLVFFLMRSYSNTPEPPKLTDQPGNQFVDSIKTQIKILAGKPDSEFCKDYYELVSYHIEDYHDGGKFDSTSTQNDQWEVNLNKMLYAEYADKFIKQALYVFSHPAWEIKDLTFIRSEYQALRSSPLLQPDNPLHARFNEIQTILTKHDEITAFISSCNGFSCRKTDLDEFFPIDDVKTKIASANNYRSNQLENAYVNNCERLHKGLNEIPAVLFKAHCDYLDHKSAFWSKAYTGYNSFTTYREKVWDPFKREIQTLDNNIYHLPNFQNEYDNRFKPWQKEGEDAYDYKYD